MLCAVLFRRTFTMVSEPGNVGNLIMDEQVPLPLLISDHAIPACAHSNAPETAQPHRRERFQSTNSPQQQNADLEPQSSRRSRRRRKYFNGSKGAYKTELCRCIVEGTHCRFGARRCKWAHSLEDMIDHLNGRSDIASATPILAEGDAATVVNGSSAPVRRYSLNEPPEVRNLLPTSIWAELLITSYGPASLSRPSRASSH